jgi:hypothetical protein
VRAYDGAIGDLAGRQAGYLRWQQQAEEPKEPRRVSGETTAVVGSPRHAVCRCKGLTSAGSWLSMPAMSLDSSWSSFTYGLEAGERAWVRGWVVREGW